MKALSRIIPAAAVAMALAALAAPAATDGSLTAIGSVTVPGGAGGEGIAAA